MDTIIVMLSGVGPYKNRINPKLAKLHFADYSQGLLAFVWFNRTTLLY